MVDVQELGKTEKVGLKEFWTNEATNFTPRLADHIDILGEELNLELRCPRTEVYVGNYRVDILAKSGDGYKVVIENQFGWTDHDHLGKILTYRVGKSAGYVVWVASYFTSEHRAVVDWLNRMASRKVWFFGVEARLIRIGDSDLAPDFRVVAAPREFAGGYWEPVELTPGN